VPLKPVPPSRVAALNDADPDPGAGYVLYWMTSARRTRWNFALQRAVEWASRLRKPLLVLEVLKSDYRWASDRLHRLMLDGIADTSRQLAQRRIAHYVSVERNAGESGGLVQALASHACVVVTDEFPAFFLPRMVREGTADVGICAEMVDSNGLLPLRATDRTFPSAYVFRRFLQRTLPPHLADSPAPDPLRRASLPPLASLPADCVRRWPPVDGRTLSADPSLLSSLSIDHSVPVSVRRGGSTAALATLESFIDSKLSRYVAARNDPASDVTSGLSPYLHFGHISAHQVFADVTEWEGWTPASLSTAAADGRRAGWWGMTESAEAFLDQLIVWRELGFNMCVTRTTDYDQFESLPEWARATLRKHARDRRAYIYSLAQFESAETHDPLWNAAQRQLLTEGIIHNYLRMLWGKKILEWSRSPEEALEIMIELNNKYALDGRDPNSYSGIFWILGRYDRPWGPERPVYGTIRYMSSENTARKYRVGEYIRKYTRE